MFCVVVGGALGCVFLHPYMKSYSGPIKGESFFLPSVICMQPHQKEYCHTRSLRLCRVLFSSSDVAPPLLLGKLVQTGNM